MTYPMQVLLHIVVVALYKIDFYACYVSSNKASEQLLIVRPRFFPYPVEITVAAISDSPPP